MRVHPGADGRAAERDFAQRLRCLRDAPTTALDLAGVALELLAERDRRRIHEVCPARLQDITEGSGAVVQRGLEAVKRGREFYADSLYRSQVDGGGDGVVRGLSAVHVVVRVDGLVDTL